VLLTRDRAVTLQAKLFRGLSDYSRLSILQVLRDGPLTVREIVAVTGLSQPNVSNHLRCLSDCCLVASEQRGRFVHYRLNSPRVMQLLAMADEVLSESAEALDKCQNYT
jgi:ArsR family transcriptional regulator, cadmium/lead-responsive transcriptional repressor